MGESQISNCDREINTAGAKDFRSDVGQSLGSCCDREPTHGN